MQTPSPHRRIKLRITRALWQLPPAERREFLWQQLQQSLSGNQQAIGWLLDELGKFLDSEWNNKAERQTAAPKKNTRPTSPAAKNSGGKRPKE